MHGESDPLRGTPLDPDTYDYRAQTLSLIFFPHPLDRLWQNYRRPIGWKIQYASAVEMQRRLATHAHYAVRGTANAPYPASRCRDLPPGLVAILRHHGLQR